MYELHQVGENSFYIQAPAKIGVVKLNEKDVCLIDSGNDKNAGRRIRQILDDKGWNLTAIYNTHSNADHIGGNKYLQQNTGCKIYTNGIECDFTNHPILEPSFLYGGFPCGDLRHKFLLAQESRAEQIKNLPDVLSIISLKGHFFDMVGFRTDDDVVYLADCLSSRETLDKYKITFIYDVGAYLNTLETVKEMKANIFIPSHAEVTDNIQDLVRINIDAVYEVAGKILDICSIPSTFEKILKELFSYYRLQMNFEQYVLVGSTVRSYLSWLKDNERIVVHFNDNEMLWQSKE